MLPLLCPPVINPDFLRPLHPAHGEEMSKALISEPLPANTFCTSLKKELPHLLPCSLAQKCRDGRSLLFCSRLIESKQHILLPAVTGKRCLVFVHQHWASKALIRKVKQSSREHRVEVPGVLGLHLLSALCCSSSSCL